MLFCLLLPMQGCKTSKKKDSDSGGQQPAVGAPFDVRGRVNSNNLLHIGSVAQISLHPVIKGQVHLNVSVASTSTDDNGVYLLTVADKYLGQPVVIRAFIEDEGLELLLAVPNLSPNFTNNITLLTHFAASKLVEAANWGSKTQASIAISDANTQVASRFGVIGDLSSLPLVNLWDRDELSQSNNFSIRYSALGLAVLQAASKDSPSASTSEIVKQFTSSYILFGMAGNTNAPQVTSYAEVLTELRSIFKSIKPDFEDIAVLDRLLIEVATELGLASAEAPDQYEKGFSASGSGLSYVDKAKALIKDMRQIVASIDISSIVGLSNISKLLGNDDPITDKLEGFGIQVNISELVSGDEFAYIQDALKSIALAVVDKLACVKTETCGNSLSSVDASTIVIDYTVESSMEGNGVRELYQFIIKQNLNVCLDKPLACNVSVDLAISLDLLHLRTGIPDAQGNIDYFELASGAIRMNGSLSHGGVTFEARSDQPQITLGQTEISLLKTIRGAESTDSFYIVTENTAITLPVTLSKSNDQDVNGLIDFKVTDAEVELIDNVYESFSGSNSSTVTNSDIVVTRMKGLALNIAGVVNEPEQENFLVSLNFAQPGGGFVGNVKYHQTTVSDCALSAGAQVCIETDLGSSFEGETIENGPNGLPSFVKLDASIGYKAILKGVADPVIVQLSGSRESPDTSSINGLSVAYPGHSLNLHGQFNNKGKVVSMGASNLEGITMTVETKEQGKRYGTLSGPDGSHLAEITPTTDMVHITFDDGYFVSLIL